MTERPHGLAKPALGWRECEIVRQAPSDSLDGDAEDRLGHAFEIE